MQDSWLGSRLKTFSISALNSFSTPGEVNKQERMFCQLHLKRYSIILVAKSGECTRSQIRRNAKAPSYPLPIANWIIKHFFLQLPFSSFPYQYHSLYDSGQIYSGNIADKHIPRKRERMFQASPLLWYPVRAVSKSSYEIQNSSFSPEIIWIAETREKMARWPRKSSRFPGGLIVPQGNLNFPAISFSPPNGILAFRRSIAECREDLSRCSPL